MSESSNKNVANYTSIQIFFYVLFLLITLFSIFYLWNTLSPFLLGLGIAYVLDPIVKKVEKYSYLKSHRTLIVLFIFIIFFLIVAYFFTTLFFIFSNEKNLITIISNLNNDLTTYIKKISDYILVNKNIHYFDIGKLAISISDYIEQFFKEVLFSLGNTLLNSFNHMIYIFLVFISVFFFLKDKKFFIHLLKKNFLFLYQNPFRSFFQEVDMKIGNYIKTQILLSIIVTILTSTFLFYFENLRNYAILFGILAGITNFIPYLGAIISSLPPLIISFFSNTELFFILLIFYTILNGVVGLILTPKLTSNKLNIHPLSVFIYLSVGKSLFGIWGMILAIPLGIILGMLISLLLKKIYKDFKIS